MPAEEQYLRSTTDILIVCRHERILVCVLGVVCVPRRVSLLEVTHQVSEAQTIIQ